MAFPIFGGVHPKENKWYASEKTVQEFPEPDVLVIPMSQHIGAICKPLVRHCGAGTFSFANGVA